MIKEISTELLITVRETIDANIILNFSDTKERSVEEIGVAVGHMTITRQCQTEAEGCSSVPG